MNPMESAQASSGRIRLHDVAVDDMTMAGALAAIEGFIRTGGPHHVVTLDASMCVYAATDIELRRIVTEADLVTPDGIGVIWAARRRGGRMPERVSGVVLVERLCEISSRSGFGLAFLGAAPGVAQAAADRMAATYPGCRVVYTHDGYFAPDDEAAIALAIRESGAQVVCVALGIPKQEKWIARHAAATGASVLIGVGGTFDVLSGNVARAPLLIQKLALEWLYRLLKNPSKIGKAMTLPVFVWRTLTSRSDRS